MKKVILMAMVAVFLLTSTVCAFADTTAYQPNKDGKYTVTYNVGTQNAGNMYGFVVIKGTDVIDLDNIDDYVYIDQATADANGNITFENFGLKGALPSDEAFVESTAYIGGKGYDTAQTIGVMVAAELGNAVTGTVTDANNPRTATVTFKNASDVVVATATANNGAYSAELDNGTYSAIFTKDGSLSYTYTGIIVDGDKAIAAVDMSSLAGNCVTGNEINFYDLSAVLSIYNNKNVNLSVLEDVNGTGDINFYDLSVIITNYNSSNVTKAYAN